MNNAGFGVNQGFVAGDLADEERLLDVLVRATLRLTHAALPGMVQRGAGIVINVSSVAGWVPMGTYAAAKSWVTVFTEGLGAELSGTGVTATAVCPGFTRTEFHERADMDVVFLPEWAWLDARRVARDGLRDARAGRAVSVPSKRYGSLALVAQYAPRPLLRRAGNRIAQSRAGRQVTHVSLRHSPLGWANDPPPRARACSPIAAASSARCRPWQPRSGRSTSARGSRTPTAPHWSATPPWRPSPRAEGRSTRRRTGCPSCGSAICAHQRGVVRAGLGPGHGRGGDHRGLGGHRRHRARIRGAR